MDRRNQMLKLTYLAIVLVCLTDAIAQHTVSNRATGLIFATTERFRAIPVARVARAVRLPEGDLSKWAPPAGDQGTQNSCVGWAVGYAARTIIAYRTGGNNTGPFSPSYIYNRGRALEAASDPKNSGSDCNLGMQIETGLGLLEGLAIFQLRTFPIRKTNASRCRRSRRTTLRNSTLFQGGVGRSHERIFCSQFLRKRL